MTPIYLIYLFQVELLPLVPPGESLWVTSVSDEFVVDQDFTLIEV